MTTEEFKYKLHELEYKTNSNTDWITVLNGRSAIVAEIRVNRLYALNTDYFAFTDNLGDVERQMLIQLIDAYAKTPLEER